MATVIGREAIGTASDDNRPSRHAGYLPAAAGTGNSRYHDVSSCISCNYHLQKCIGLYIHVPLWGLYVQASLYNYVVMCLLVGTCCITKCHH